ncbi:glycosyltransferase family 61 protein [uncultured Brachyspira sp.]|uniref:glycosyltransferase family 61 protein n=1 Tax=uncultured Brachyspira sp. TaxID=221953 RepID=UPI0026151E5F|nr:glycosyltransferase family 61 protein [uncultured Brachyspira sp.]
MPIFNKLLHSSIRNKLSKNIYDNLKKSEIEAKDSEHSSYIPIQYSSSNKIDYICYIKNAVVYSDWGFIFTKEGKFIKDNLPPNVLDYKNELTGRFLFSKFRRRLKIKGNVFLLKSQWQNYYGHWIHDILSRLFILKDSGLFDKIDTFIISEGCKAKFYKESLELFGIKNVINVPDEKRIECENLFFSSFPCLEVSKPFKWECDKFLEFTEGLLNKCNIDFYDKIYISRKKVKTRNIINEKELLDILIPLGYKVIYPEDYSIAEQFCLFNKAKKIISVLGSGLTNIICCDEKTSLFGIVADVRYEDCHKYICSIKGMKYFEYIEDNPKNIHYFYNIKDRDKYNFSIDLERFKKVLEEFEKS